MQDLASWALNVGALRGASYADARIANDRGRALSTKNGKVGGASDAESFGIGIRVIANGSWGFATSTFSWPLLVRIWMPEAARKV